MDAKYVPPCTRIGSFEEWCRIIGGIPEFAGVEGFLENRSSFRENADREREQWKSLLRLLRERFTGRTFSSAQVKNYFDTHEPPVSHYLPDELQDTYEE